jgi:F-type H+-transporting ATPase subunit delta
MRGASTESAAVLGEQLTAAADDGADVVRLADDLFGVADVLRREGSLRRTVTDASLRADAKADLVRGIFGDALSPAAVDLVASAVGRRWASSRDLGDTLEYLGVVAVVRGAEQHGEADRLEDELFGFGRLVADNPGLRDALSDPARSVGDKQDLARTLLEGRTTAATSRLAQQAVTGSYRTVPLAVEAYQKIAADHRNVLVATVRVARELADGDAERLAGALQRQYDRPVHLNVMIDPDVIGGMRVDIGDDVIDGTVSSRLDDARRRLAG